MRNVTLPLVFKPYQCNDLIRLGKVYDGGYLVNKHDVLNTKCLLSFGIGEDYSFEEQFTNLAKCPVVAYDDSVSVKTTKNYNDFFQHENVHIAEKVSAKNIEQVLTNIPDQTFLKCDIEGGEYEIIDHLIYFSHKFTGVAIELHDVSKYENFNKVTCLISKLNQKLVHVHINNYMYYKVGDEPNQQIIPDVFELMFTSSSNVVWNPNIRLPHLFDMPNNPNDLEFSISF